MIPNPTTAIILPAPSKRVKLDWHFHEFRLEPETVFAANGTLVVCVFVNDVVNREVLERLAGSGVRLVASRCAGFNNVALEAAKNWASP